MVDCEPDNSSQQNAGAGILDGGTRSQGGIPDAYPFSGGPTLRQVFWVRIMGRRF